MANNIFDDVSRRIELNTESIQHDLTVFVERVKENPHSAKVHMHLRQIQSSKTIY